MIDNEREVQSLIEALNQHLPIRAFATPHLVNSLRDQGTRVEMSDAFRIESVLYLGDMGGIGCALGLSGETAVVVSITHLRIEASHPLYERVKAYQERRSQKLEEQDRPRPQKSPASVATKRLRARSASKGKVAKKSARKDSVWLRFQTAQRCWLSGEFERAATGFRVVGQLCVDFAASASSSANVQG